MNLPKYARPEIERRWLAQIADVGSLPQCGWDIDDRYLDGTRMRLRRMTDLGDGQVTYKLAKKYGAQVEDGVRWEPIVNTTLSADEYLLFSTLRGRNLRKRRHLIDHDGVRYGVDIFPSGLVLVEAEYPTLEVARNASAPPFAAREVTGERAYECAALAHAE